MPVRVLDLRHGPWRTAREGNPLASTVLSKAFSKRHLVQKMRELSFRLFRALTPHLKSIVIEDVAGNAVVAIARDNFITFECVKYGEYVSSPVHQALAFNQRLGQPLRGTTFLDVGANIGTETVSALRSGAFSAAIAIEPVRDNLENLHMALCANGLSERVQVIAAAVSSRPGVMRMQRSATNAGDHRIVEGEAGGGAHFIDVPVTTIDEAVARCGLQPSAVGLIFIDVQGHEPEALEGASALLREGIPLVIEYTPADMSRQGQAEKLLRVLRDHYDAFVVLEKGAVGGPSGIEELLGLRDSPLEHLDLFVYRRAAAG